MSSDGSAYVYRHSPYKGAIFAAHLALGDVTNDTHGNEIYLSVGSLAVKSRISRRSAQNALDSFVADGFLSVIETRPGGTTRYQFEFPSKPVIYDTRSRVQEFMGDGRKVRTHCTPSWNVSGIEGVQPTLEGVQPAHEGVQSQHLPHISELKELKKNPASEIARGPERPSVDPVRDLVRRVWERKNPKPAQPFVAIVNIARSLTTAGHALAAIEEAMVAVPTISTRWVEAEIARTAKAVPKDFLDDPNGGWIK